MTGRSRREGAIAIPLSAEERGEWQGRLSKMAILEHLGVRLDLSGDDAVRLVLERCTPAHAGGLGAERLNGAMIAGMVDCAMSIAGILQFGGRTSGTMQLSIQFMKPVKCKQVVVECRVVRRTTAVAFVEARLLEADGRCAVMATGMVGVARVASRQGSGDGTRNWASPVGMGSSASSASDEASLVLAMEGAL